MRLRTVTPLHPNEFQASAGPTCVLADISPSEFANVTLPVYKAMFAHMPTTAMFFSGILGDRKAPIRNVILPKYYTSGSFGRLLISAGRQLRLKPAHFRSALHAIMSNSGLVLAPNLVQEQVSHRISCLRTTKTADFPTSRHIALYVAIGEKQVFCRIPGIWYQVVCFREHGSRGLGLILVVL